MNIFIEEHRQLLKQLTDAGVTFILVGGYAVIFHGYVRTTGDMDIWLQPANHNKEKLLPVLTSKGFRKSDIEKLKRTDFTQAFTFHYGESPLRVDFLTKLTGLNFDECYGKVSLLNFEEYKIPVLNYNDLVINKMLAGRPKDKGDVDELQKIMKLKKTKKGF
jgi:hypothetical protein